MKVQTSVKKRCAHCKIVKRRGQLKKTRGALWCYELNRAMDSLVGVAKWTAAKRAVQRGAV